MMTVIATVVREDMVLNDTLAGISESNAETTDESDTEENVEDIFTTTKWENYNKLENSKV